MKIACLEGNTLTSYSILTIHVQLGLLKGTVITMYRPPCADHEIILEGEGGVQRKFILFAGARGWVCWFQHIWYFCYVNLMSLNFRSWSNP